MQSKYNVLLFQFIAAYSSLHASLKSSLQRRVARGRRDFLGYVRLGSMYYSNTKPAPDATSAFEQRCRKYVSAGSLFYSKPPVRDNQVQRRQQQGRNAWRGGLRAPRARGFPRKPLGSQTNFFGELVCFFLEVSQCFSRVDSKPV